MVENFYPDFEQAEYEVYERKFSFSSLILALVSFIIAIGVLITILILNGKIKSTITRTMWLIFSVAIFLTFVFVIKTIGADRSEYVKFALFKDNFAFFSYNGLYKNTYVTCDYSEIKEWGFIPFVNPNATSPYLVDDLFNYGECIITLENDGKLSFKVDDIVYVRELLKERVLVEESLNVEISDIFSVQEFQERQALLYMSKEEFIEKAREKGFSEEDIKYYIETAEDYGKANKGRCPYGHFLKEFK